MELRKIKDSNPNDPNKGTLTLAWDPVPGAEGWLFYLNGKRVSKSFDVSKRTVQFSKPGVYRVQAVTFSVVDQDTFPDPPPQPPPAAKRYAPRTHNLGNHDQDPRFCCKPEYGVVDHGGYYEDEMGCQYDKDKMMSAGGPGGYRDRGFLVAELTGADDMNSKEPCDEYVGPTGRTNGGANGYPGDPYAQTGSFHR